MNRHEQRELRDATARELLADVESSEPEMEDERLSYVTVQIDRTLWLRIKALPRPPYIVEYPPLFDGPVSSEFTTNAKTMGEYKASRGIVPDQPEPPSQEVRDRTGRT